MITFLVFPALFMHVVFFFHFATANKRFLTSRMYVKFHSRHNNPFLYQIAILLLKHAIGEQGVFEFYSTLLFWLKT